jgi:membrane protease YdiL (CAAX protease family)
MYRIRRFGVLRTATVVAVAYAIAFAFVAIPLALIGLAAPRGAFAMAAVVPALLFVLLVVYPIVIWVFTAIACLVYNLAARFVGGIEVQVERPPQAWTAPPGAWAGQAPGGWQPGPGEQRPPG